MITRLLEKILTNKKTRLLLFSFIGLIIFYLSYNNGMFWDNVLFASKMGNQLYYNSIFNWFMPDIFDPGHPPFLGFLLAISWKILGHKLWVSHLLILPFTIGFFYQLFKFIENFVKGYYLQFLAFILVIADPTLSTAFVLVNPEIVIIFFFFLTVNSIIYKSPVYKIVGLLFLSIITYRSMMLFAGIFIFDIINKLLLNKKNIKSVINFRFLLTYFLGSLPAMCFIIWRLLTKGWIYTYPNSPWADYGHFASFKIFMKNCIVLVHRYLDFGRVFIFIFIAISIFIYGRKIIKSKKNKELLLLSIASVIFIIIAVLVATNTFGHRYFIVSYICLNLLSFLIIKEFYSRKKIIYTLLLVGLIMGNLWIYPRKISQGWDATLAHLPYHSLRLEAIDYLNSNDIEIESVASFFPNRSMFDEIDFRGCTKSFTEFNRENKYVFYSSVYNLSDKYYDTLDKNYILIKKFEKFNVYIYIYRIKEL